MTRPTDELKTEHQAVLLSLDILEHISHQIQSGNVTDLADLKALYEILTVFVDKCHHGKEENVLFPALIQLGMPRDGGPVGVMLAEHDNGRAYIKGIGEAIQASESGNTAALNAFAENALGYATLMRQHIYKEDNILYPMADMHLSDIEQNALTQSFREIEGHQLLPGQREQFMATLRQFETIYLR